MINRQWTTFEGRAYGRAYSEQIRITIGPRGVFYLNKAAFEVMGGPAAVEMNLTVTAASSG